MILTLLALAVSFAAVPGDPLPAVALTDAHGAQAVLTPGPVRVVNLWAAWCGPCRKELPLLDAMQVRLGTEAEVVFVSVDTSRVRAVALAKHLGLTSRMLFDGEPFAAVMKPETLPTTFVVGLDGTIRHVHAGELDATAVAALEAEVRALVPAPTAPIVPAPNTP